MSKEDRSDWKGIVVGLKVSDVVLIAAKNEEDERDGEIGLVVHAMSTKECDHQLTYDAVVEEPDKGVLSVAGGGLLGSGVTSDYVLEALSERFSRAGEVVSRRRGGVDGVEIGH